MTGVIERVSLTHLQIPLKEPSRAGGAEAAVKDAILVTVETSGGVGIGESSLPLDSPDTLARCWDDLVEHIAPRLLGARLSSPAEIAALHATWRGSPYALAGAETACWDLLGRARHASIAELLGASPEQAARGVESGLSVGLYPTVVELLQTIETHLAEGFRRVKLTIQPGQDVELVSAVRQHFGDALPLMVDARGSYSVADLDLFRALDAFDLLMIERPADLSDLEGLVEILAAVVTPLCLDASAETLGPTAEAIRRGACRIVSLKIQELGGLGPALALHDLCFQQGVATWVGAMPELGIGQALGIHLGTLANCKYPTDVEPSARWFVDDYVAPPLELSAPGVFQLPGRPGLGFEVDHAKVRRYQVRQQQFTSSKAR